MTLAPFDTDALRQLADFELPFDDHKRAQMLWRSAQQDLLAAADHIELCLLALAQAANAESLRQGGVS
jgi:hypothetical protein